MLNMQKVNAECKQMLISATEKGRTETPADMQVLNFLISYYCISDIYEEDVITLWREYLTKGTLDLAKVNKDLRSRQMAV